MKKSAVGEFVRKAIGGVALIIICLIAGLLAKNGIQALFENERLLDCCLPLGVALCMFLSVVGAILLARKTNAGIKRDKALKRLHPDQPWLWQQKWADGKMTSDNKSIIIIQLFVSGVALLVGGGGLFLCLASIIEGEYLRLLTAVFPIAGLILGYFALCSLNRYLKFGESTFQMACVPGIVGGELAGVIHTKAKEVPAGGFVLKLQSVKATSSGSGDTRTTRYEVLWEDTHKVSVDLGASGGDGKVVLPVSFAIPFECESCSETPTENPKLSWNLSVDAEFSGSNFHCEFDVPVFKTPESQPDFQLSIAEQSFSEETPLASL